MRVEVAGVPATLAEPGGAGPWPTFVLLNGRPISGARTRSPAIPRPSLADPGDLLAFDGWAARSLGEARR